MKRIVVVVNEGSGHGNDEALAERVRGLFQAAGAAVEVILARGSEVGARAERAVAQQADVVVAGGGDGTVSAVAAVLAGSETALGVLPLGTLNHFAKDLGLPLALDEAVASIVAGRTSHIDVGEVNGRVFINNSSLGLYPDIVRERERQQRRIGRGKWPALVWAGVSALRRYPFLNVRIFALGREHLRRTPFVFIGNNEYRMEGFAIGERNGLAGGCLSLYTAQRPGRLRLVQLAIRALVGRLRQARDFDIVLAAEIIVESRHHRLRVASDGEVTYMTPPLRYRIRPASLIVIGTDKPRRPHS
ncbi:MAG: diacylglycerol kinase family protein [Caldimonas sp.]